MLRKYFCFTCFAMLAFCKMQAQTNTFPSTGSAGVGTPTPDDKLQVIGNIGFQKRDLQGTINYIGRSGTNGGGNAAWIGFGVDSNYNNFLNFGTLHSGVSGGERMRIHYNGNVGIGTDNPVTKLDVSSNAPSSDASVIQAKNTGTNSSNQSANILLDAGGSGKGYIRVNSSATTQTLGTSSDMTIMNAYNYFPDYGKLLLGTQNKIRAVIDAKGNVGIGPGNPEAKLHIKDSGDVDVVITGAERSRINLSTATQQGWQIEVTEQTGDINQAIGDLGFTESGVSGGRLVLKKGGFVGIGTTSPTEKLSVNGNIRAKKLIVSQTGWPDYVFADDYALPRLSSVENFIKQNKHLPGIPSVKEIEKNGVDVGDNQALLLKKIEELTLYMIALNKKNDELALQNKKLHERLLNIENKN